MLDHDRPPLPETPPAEPYALFAAWYEQAKASEPNDPNAMSLATIDDDGTPSVRIVLMKDWDESGFVFFTNSQSRKGRALAANARVALCLHWKSLGRQVRVEGLAAPVDAAEVDAYFATRPRDSRIGAWASAQSSPLASAADLAAAVAATAARFGDGAVPRPPHWWGYRVAPKAIELWQERPFRLHDRIRFERTPDGWTAGRLFP